MSAFRVGQKVVCVVGGEIQMGGFGYLGATPIRGMTYVVAGTSKCAGVDGDFGVLIDSLPNFGTGFFSAVDFGWVPWRFRPLTTQSEDIALFTHHFDRERADA